MAFPTDDILLGPRTYGARKGHEGIIYHTTEGSGPTRDNAVATAKLQSPGGSLYAGGGSYNFIIYDGGVLLTVPYLESAGGLTLERTNPPWAPEPWLKTLLSPAAFADPNAYHLQIAFSGKAAELAAGKYPANMIDTAARLLIWFEQSDFGKDNAIVSGHSTWQSNRSDPGAGVVDKILARYSEILNPPAPIDYKALYDAERAKNATLRNTIRTQTETIAELKTKISAAKTALA